MSLSGVRSNRGDDYQRAIATYWVIEMLIKNEILQIQVDAISIPGKSCIAFQDDVVIHFSSGKTVCIQAKVNQTNHQYWRLSDNVLKEELLSAKKQLDTDNTIECHFYSRTPFNTLQRLLEESSLFDKFQTFKLNAPNNQNETLKKLSEIWGVTDEKSFNYIKRIKIGAHHQVEGWERFSEELLKSSFSNSKLCYDLIYHFVDKTHSGLGEFQFVIEREQVLDFLKGRGIYLLEGFDEQKVLRAFHAFSQKGRQWVRTIGGERIARNELKLLKDAIQNNASTILLEDVAGGGKTCLLLDLIDFLDQAENINSLFIRGDLYSHVNSLEDLKGLPKDLISSCIGLAQTKQLVIVIDSLDVLAIGRSHNSLSCFLGLIAELSEIENITIIAAGRSFDIQYDPLLRELEWSHRITINPLSFSNDIKPLFSLWGFNISNLGIDLQKLLIIPQNLRLFYELINKGISISDLNESNLYDSYISEVIENDEDLGETVVQELEQKALALLKKRENIFSERFLNLNQTVIKRLLSQNILTNDEVSQQLMFSHQTLADALRIRKALKDDIQLNQFITSQPQLPFIRPAIKSFTVYLRSLSPRNFVRQYISTLSDDLVAMHIKRLLVETLAQLSPTKDDKEIITQLYNCDSSLLERFLSKAQSNSWFTYLREECLESFFIHPLTRKTYSLIRYFSDALDKDEEWVISFWNKVFDEGWLEHSYSVILITSKLEKVNCWTYQAIPQLLEKLLNESTERAISLGKVICKFVENTNSGDELLWNYIIKDVKNFKNLESLSKIKFNCESHHLLSETFLEQRLVDSDLFFSLALDYILDNIENVELNNYPSLRSDLLYATSWEKRHNSHDHYYSGSVHDLIGAVEKSLKVRSLNNDSCWQKYEPLLRESNDIGLRYLACEAYLENLKKNIEGVCFQLTDKELIKKGRVDFELCRLARAVYHLLPLEIQGKHQEIVSTLYEEDIDGEKEFPEWIERTRYLYLKEIPCIFREPKFDDFIIKCEEKFSNFPVKPRRYSGGGFVRSPFSSEELIDLKPKTFINLIKHYNNYNRDGFDFDLIGGRDSLCAEINNATSLEPMKFIPLIALIEKEGLSNEYIFSIMKGLASHLRIRFGNLSDNNWREVEPLPCGEELALTLLTLIEKYHDEDIRAYTTVRSIEGCIRVLDAVEIKRVYPILQKLSAHENPTLEDKGDRDLVGIGINSIRGSVANIVLIICNKKLEKGQELDSELIQLLNTLSKDESMAVRATLLYRFPFFLYKNHSLGWSLIDIMIKGAEPDLFKYLEKCLYNEYHSNFDKVEPYLNVLYNVSEDKSSEAWGRIATLSFLAGHISKEVLWNKAKNTNTNSFYGMSQVFTSNVTSKKHTNLCLGGLRDLFEMQYTERLYSKLEQRLSDKDFCNVIDHSLIKSFIENVPVKHAREIDGLFDWFEVRVDFDFMKVLELLELLINKLSSLDSIHFYKPESLLVTLNILLQKADLLDNNQLIERVLNIQDWFLEKGVTEIEQMLEACN